MKLFLIPSVKAKGAIEAKNYGKGEGNKNPEFPRQRSRNCDKNISRKAEVKCLGQVDDDQFGTVKDSGDSRFHGQDRGLTIIIRRYKRYSPPAYFETPDEVRKTR